MNRAATALLAGAVATVSVACTDGPSERRTLPTEAPTTSAPFDTLPPVLQFAYPEGSADVVAQVEAATAASLPLPLITIYGDGRVIAATNAAWVQGTVDVFEVQDFLEEADEVGLLGESLVLRDVDEDEPPDIVVSLDVDGNRLRHEFDLARIEWPIQPRAFLNRAATQNIFELSEPYRPTSWINCEDGECAAESSPAGPTARPVLPHEDVEILVSEANAATS